MNDLSHDKRIVQGLNSTVSAGTQSIGFHSQTNLEQDPSIRNKFLHVMKPDRQDHLSDG